MPTFNDAAAYATEAQQALRGLAHATRSIDDPRPFYSVLGSLSEAAASLEQSFHQLATLHDSPAWKSTWVNPDDRTTRTASYQVSWELHRAGEILRQVAASLDHAHEVEGSITYDLRRVLWVADPPRPTHNQGLSL